VRIEACLAAVVAPIGYEELERVYRRGNYFFPPAGIIQQSIFHRVISA
jgi:hypothetical protein